MNRKKSMKNMLNNDIGAEQSKVVHHYLLSVLEHIDDQDGLVRGAISTVSGGGNSVSQSIYYFVNDLVQRRPDIYMTITGIPYPVEPRKFVSHLYEYWTENYRED